MKKQKRKIILFILIIFILCIFLFRNKESNGFQDELIFFKIFSSGQGQEKSINQSYKQYNFKVSYKNIDFKNIYLSDTINKETLIREKIAPGTKGTFEILLESDEKINYQIQFESKNEKPQNLIFKIDGKDRKYNKLEEMQQELKGEIEGNKRIIIHWEWEYDTNVTQDLQDTKDGENIKQYIFTIYAIGK